MHKLYQTIGSGDLRTNVNDAFKLTEKGPVVVLSRTQPKAVMVHPDQWNQMAEELRRYRIIAEARQIEARNDANNSWTSGEEMRQMMAERGVHVGD